MGISMGGRPCVFGLWRLLECLALLATLCPIYVQSERVHITVISVGFSEIERTSNTQLQCRQSSPSTAASRDFGRTAPIPSDTSPDPPTASSFAYDVRRIQFPFNAEWGVQGFGAFYCRGSQEGYDYQTISSFFKRSDACFEPVDGKFTRTVNVGDTGLMIEMRSTGRCTSQDHVWRKDGGDPVSGQMTNTFMFSTPIVPEDEGIYEIYYSGMRSQGRGALYRLIVRGCPAGKWGPPDCIRICDKCYNGGVCDDETGRCICPNNFKGPNCLEICRRNGGNRFGPDCEFKCTYSARDPADNCSPHQFCLPDPFGCSCDTGTQGINCNTVCDSGFYGAGCSQTCHCQSGACDRYSGVCTPSNCEANWSGENCQIPDICDDGYYGNDCTEKCHCLNDAPCDKITGECPNQQCAPYFNIYDGVNCQECPGAFYGLGCKEPCHCDESTCDKVTGICRGQCLPNWVERDCQTGVASVTNVKVNPNQSSSFTCVVEGDPPANAAGVSFYQLRDGVRDDSGISQNQSSLDTSGEKRTIVFTVTQVTSGEYECALYGNRASLSVDAMIYVLPVIEAAPTVTASTSTSLTIEWMAWNEQTGIGDPPLTEYITYYRIPNENWIDGPKVAASMRSAVLTGLDPDTDYEVSIAAAREGPGGTGPRSNSSANVTKCANPSASPILVSATSNVPRQITVIWQAPPSGTAQCRSGFTNYVVHYTTEIFDFSGSESPAFSSTEVTLTDLEPYLEYTITVTAANKDSESLPSSEMTVRTPEEIPPSPVNVAISDSTQDSLTVTWSAATPVHRNGEILAYKLEYRRTAPNMDNYFIVRKVNVVQHDVMYRILDLSPGSMYSIQVRTINGVGESDWSPIIIGETKSQPAAKGAVAGGVVGVLVIFIIVGLVVGFIYYRRNQDKKECDGTDELSGHVLYENPEPVELEEHPYEGLKSVAVFELTAPVSNSKHKASLNPKHYPSHHKDQMDGSGDREMDASKKPGSFSGSRKWGGSHDNLAEEHVYHDVTAPSSIPIHELQAYIKSKKAEKGNGLIQEYHMLKSSQLHPWDVASKKQNKSKNRVKNIIAYDHSRVVLETVDGDPHSDYYNANYMHNYRGEKVLIASQAPNKASLTDFWRMIWQENVETIVIVTNLIENGKNQCSQYWPKESQSVNIGKFSIFSYKEHTYTDRAIRELVVTKGRDEEKRTVTQFHYMSWPDMGVPEYYTTLLDFVEAVLHHHTTMPLFDGTRPMLVHCSAGAGRTGTFLTLCNMLCMMQETGKVDIFGFVNQMRENRIEMIQTQDQYVFLYTALLEVYLSGQTNIPVSQFKEKLDTLNGADPKTKKTYIQLEYELLDTLAPVPPSNAFRGGKMPQNRNKNRFPDILPLESKRPCLASEGLEDSTDYINASFMSTFTEKDVFVATQAPLPNTVVDIWRLVFDLKCPVIVMLNELDPTDETCAQYWPNEGTLQLGTLNIAQVGSSSAPHFDSNTFTVSSKGESMTVTQFRLFGWSAASNKLRSPMSLIHLVKAVQKAVKTAHTSGPVIVHCINGVGRSGVFCALWSVIDKCQRENTVDIFHAVQGLRANRPNMVESLSQYKLCYDAMSRYLQQEKVYMVYMNVDTSR